MKAATSPGLPTFLPQHLSLPGENKSQGAWKGREVTAIGPGQHRAHSPKAHACDPLLQQGGEVGRKRVWIPWEMKQSVALPVGQMQMGGRE